MKVLHIIGGLERGGAEKSLLSLITAKRKQYYEQYVISLQKGGVNSEKIKQAGIKLYELETHKFSDAVASIFRLSKLIKEINPNIIQSWMYYADLFSIVSLYISGKRKKIKIFWGIRCSNLNLSEYSLKLRIVVNICKYLSRLPDGIVANSISGKDYHINDMGYKNEKFIIIHNGIDLDKYSCDLKSRNSIRKELNIPEDKTVVSHVARVDPMKDHETFLNTVSKLPDLTVLLIGKGTENFPNISNVIKLGEREDIVALLSASDFFVSSSRFGEGFSNAISEAMSCELPVIATNTGDTEIILGKTGSIFPISNEKVLEDLLSRYININHAELRRMGAKSRKQIEDNFSLEIMTKQFDELYRNECQKRKEGKTHIIHVINSLFPGGAEMMLYNIMSKYNKEKYSISVITLISDGPMKRDFEKIGIDVYEANMVDAYKASIKQNILNIISFIKLVFYIRKNKPDILQSWLYHSNLIGGIAGRISGVKKIIWSIHTSNLDKRLTKFATRLVVKIGALLSNIIPKNIIYVSNVSFSIHELLGYKCNVNTIIPNGVDLEKFKPDHLARNKIRKELNISEETQLVGIVGRYDPQKDHRNFIHAASRLNKIIPSVEYVMCGTNVTKNNHELNNWIKEFGLSDKMHLLGHRNDMQRIYAALDIKAVTSGYGEAFPMVICESMACGTPCVVTDIGDSAYIVGDTGITVEKENPNALAEAFFKILKMDTTEKKKLSAKARKRIYSLFSLEKIVLEYEKYYC